MTLQAALFYLLAVAILVATGLAITRRNLVSAVIYLIFSFIGSALLFYLFGAPLLAALQVIIYAGAIMVVFLFVILISGRAPVAESIFPPRQWIPAAAFSAVYLFVAAVLATRVPAGTPRVLMVRASPREFGRYVFQSHWLSIEVVSALLLVAVLAVVAFGGRPAAGAGEEDP